ncbi:cytidine deaminase [Rhodohalobacter mucosus]|uniref:Cytidine deaminase n=1 Tax=Rhodohalobacter mucosus TaxID=2079485 RepID=A0A316TX77_9BACT|nr:cytidine deaminase [Rhodohalobacter mucosus]PWN07194.1 cytidine deaminase [Rhodohalobacter mucosus]
MINGYTPYSGNQNTCYVKGESGTFYPGVRIENVSYPLTISSVQAAVCSCLANSDNPVEYYTGDHQPELLQVWADEYDMKPGGKLPDSPLKLFDPLVPSIPDIKKELDVLTEKSVTPNSGFPVSALLQTEKGYIRGVNIELSSWALGLCAERVAISRALTAGYTQFKSIHIYAPEADFVSPCGACRQVLLEVMPDADTELYHGDGTLSKHIVSDLLPFGFTSHKLKK